MLGPRAYPLCGLGQAGVVPLLHFSEVFVLQDTYLEHCLQALNRSELLTGAWEGVPYADLPEHVQDALKVLVREIGSGYDRARTWKRRFLFRRWEESRYKAIRILSGIAKATPEQIDELLLL